MPLKQFIFTNSPGKSATEDFKKERASPGSKFVPLVFCLVVLCLLSACRKNDFDIKNLNNNHITVLGHGGMGIQHLYPINSAESVLNCLNLGAEGTEIDVQMTSDSVLVAFHDESLETSTNNSGQVFTKPWAALQNTRFTVTPFTDYKLVTLDALFSKIPDLHQYIFFLDCKNFNPDASDAYLNTFTDALLRLLDKHQLGKQVFVELKRRDVIRVLKSKRPDLNIFAYGDFDDALDMALTFQLQGITNLVDDLTEAQVRKAHKHNVMVAVLNTHSKRKNRKAVELNVDFVQTDMVKYLLGLF